jgi:hypothetical protein
MWVGGVHLGDRNDHLEHLPEISALESQCADHFSRMVLSNNPCKPN